MSFKDRTRESLKHLFDGNELNVYEENVINLGVGTPSKELLGACCEIFRVGTDHKLVRKLKLKVKLILKRFIEIYSQLKSTDKKTTL